jgi:hypothetical protein
MSVYATIELDRSGPQDIPAQMDPNNEGLVYGQNLGQCGGWDELDEIAVAENVRPLTSFIDDSEMLDDDAREEMGLPPAEENWSAIAEGIETIGALIAALEKRPATATIGQYPAEAIIWDLSAAITILNSASPPDERFRFVVA